MLLRILLVFSMIVGFPGMVLAANEPSPTLDKAVAALDAPFQGQVSAARDIGDFQGGFVQESHLVSLDRTQRGHGRVAVKFLPAGVGQRRLTLFSWQYFEPEKQEIISNGRSLWVYIPENRQVIRSEIDLETQGRPDDPMSFLTGLGNLSRDFAVAWADPAQDPDGNFILELTPRASSPLLRKLVVVVARDAVSAIGSTPQEKPVFPLVAVTVFDANGNTTRIEFHDIRVNLGLAADRFQFTVPDGVEVVRPAPLVPNP